MKRSLFFIFFFFFSQQTFAEWQWFSTQCWSQNGEPAVQMCIDAGYGQYLETGLACSSPTGSGTKKCASWSGEGTPCDDQPGTEWNAYTGTCEEVCQQGSLSEECRVFCPELTYTYYDQGIKKYGKIGAGYVGYGQQCPQPSFPPGTGSGCVSDSDSCDISDAYHESEEVEVETTDSQIIEEPDGSTTTTSSTSTSSSGPQDSSGGGSGGGSSTGNDGKTSTGIQVDPNEVGSNPADPYALSDDQVVINGETYQLCNNGSIANTTVGCDYIPPICGPNQIPSPYGCIDIITALPPPDNPPTNTTTTTTDPTGTNTTTTTTTSSGSGSSNTGSAGGSNDDNQSSSESASGGDDCNSPPVCSGDVIDCRILLEQWRTRCNFGHSATVPSDCEQAFDCEGDPIECASLQLDFERECRTIESVTNLATDAEQHFVDQGIKDLETYTKGEMFTDNIGNDGETDISQDISAAFVTTPSGTCPSPLSVDVGIYGSIEFTFQWFCDLADILRPLLLLIASIAGGTIILRALTQ